MITIKVDSNTVLRQIDQKDVDPIAAVVLANYDHLHEWLPWVNDKYSADLTSRFVLDADSQFAAGTSFQATIRREVEIAGGIGFNVIDIPNQAAEIGYWLAKKYEGTGLMSKCCRTLIAYGFEEFGLNRIMIRCASENTRSQAVPKRLGFTSEGILREAEKLHGKFVDLKVFSLLKSEMGLL